MKRMLTIDGLPVVDATEPLVIQIMAEDIHQRRRRDPGRCALAEACKRELHVSAALAYASRLYIKRDDHWVRYALPETVRQEVAAFDRGASFSTGTYRIAPMEPSRRLGTRRATGPKTRAGKPIRVTHRNIGTSRELSPLVGGGKT